MRAAVGIFSSDRFECRGLHPRSGSVPAENPNANPAIVLPSYAMLDLWIGVRIPERGFEVSLYGRNITNTNKILSDLNAADVGASFLRTHSGTSGYKSSPSRPGANLVSMHGLSSARADCPRDNPRRSERREKLELRFVTGGGR